MAVPKRYRIRKNNKWFKISKQSVLTYKGTFIKHKGSAVKFISVFYSLMYKPIYHTTHTETAFGNYIPTYNPFFRLKNIPFIGGKKSCFTHNYNKYFFKIFSLHNLLITHEDPAYTVKCLKNIFLIVNTWK